VFHGGGADAAPSHRVTAGTLATVMPAGIVTPMNRMPLDDLKVHVKLKLSALWAAVMFCYVYGDYFGLYVPGQLKGMLEGHGPIGLTSQGTLVATSLLMAVPGVMVFLSIVLPPRLDRWVNIILGTFYTLIMLATMPGSWMFYIVLGVIEILLTMAIVWYAWRWPRQT
jgi:hypothetical protein